MMKEKSRPRGLPKKLAGCGRLFSLFECLGVLVMRVSENSKIRRICISGALFLFYASRFFQCGIIVLDLSAFYEFMCKNPAPKCGIFACIFLSMQVGARGGSRTRTPLRALAPEASESTNSTTRACGTRSAQERYYHICRPLSTLFAKFSYFFFSCSSRAAMASTAREA